MTTRQTQKKSEFQLWFRFIFISIGFIILFYLFPIVVNRVYNRELISRFNEIEIVIYGLIFSIAFSVHRQIKNNSDVVDGIGGWFAMLYEGGYKLLSAMRATKEKNKLAKQEKKELAAEEDVMVTKAPKEKKFSVKSRILMLVVVVLSIITSIIFPPIMPHVQLPAEQLSKTFFTFLGQDFGLTNTLLATFLVYASLFLVGFLAYRQYQKGNEIISGIAGVFVMLFEMLYDMAVNAVGKIHAKRIFPLFATIFVVVMMANLMELIPGVDSVGFLHPSEHGNPMVEVSENVFFLVKAESDHAEAEVAEVASSESHGETFGLYPFIRAAATDLNFTLALAVVAMASVQIYGFKSLGKGYLKKFWNLDSLKEAWKEPQFGGPLNLIKAFIDWVVGLLEIVSEISKVVSFTFRLFGVIFAGQVLLFVLGSIVPLVSSVVQGPFYLIEMFFGVLQAFVFGMLTMVFMKIASTSHDHDEAHEE